MYPDIGKTTNQYNTFLLSFTSLFQSIIAFHSSLLLMAIGLTTAKL